ncbi:MAG: lamin tail domain-containing protein [Acidobacteriota bacterium]|nr:lamin tail domain-containing protein [Acidobacteriota bacterium]
MSKKSRRKTRRERAAPAPSSATGRKGRRAAAVALCALLAASAAGGALSRWGGLGGRPAAALTRAQVQTTTSSQQLSLAKEYVYAGSRLVATEEPTPTPTPGCTPSAAPSVIISEFRLYGPAGPQDEFVELYNGSADPVTVCAADGTAGWTLEVGQSSSIHQDFQPTPLPTATATIVDEDAPPPADDTPPAIPPVSSQAVNSILIPNGVTIPALGHYLLVNVGDSSNNVQGYSLAAYAAGDQTYQGDIPGGAGLALFTTADPSHFTTTYLLDAVGFSGAPAPYYEGTALSPAGGVTAPGQYSFVRQLATGAPQDTNNNASDFVFVSTDGGTYSGLASVLGAPGPENRSSPVNRNAQLKTTLIDPCQTTSNAPNRERYSASYTDPAAPAGSGTGTYPLGTITIRRRYTNNTGGSVTRLRFRVVDITAGPAPSGTADLRAITSQSTTVAVTPGCGASSSVSVAGTTLEAPPAQPMGGGFNSTYSAGSVSLSNPIGPGSSINVQFTMGVAQTGSFRFVVLVEALP